MPTTSLLRTCRNMRENSGRENREKFYCSSEVTIKLLPVFCVRGGQQEVGVSGETEVKFFTVFCGKDKRRWKKGSGRREAAKRQGVYGNFILGRNDTGGEIGYNVRRAALYLRIPGIIPALSRWRPKGAKTRLLNG